MWLASLLTALPSASCSAVSSHLHLHERRYSLFVWQLTSTVLKNPIDHVSLEANLEEMMEDTQILLEEMQC